MPKYTTEEHLIDHKDFSSYRKSRDEIQSRYPPIAKMSREEYKRYVSEVLELLLKPDGDYQKWAWDATSEGDKIKMERAAKGRKRYTRSIESDNVEYKSPYDDF